MMNSDILLKSSTIAATTSPSPSSSPILYQIELLYRLKHDLDLLVKQLNLQNCFLERVGKFRDYLKTNFMIDFPDELLLNNTEITENEENQETPDQMLFNFHREFTKFDRHYRYFERNSLKKSGTIVGNPHDTLYELYQSFILVEVDVNNDENCKSILRIGVPVSDCCDKNNNNNNNKPKIKCDFEGCRFVARGLAGLRHHKRVHNPERLFKCKIRDCSFESVKLSDFNEHKLSSHKSIMSRFKCDYGGCQYSSQYRHMLTKHRLSHNSERNFKCDFEGCGYASKRATDLNFHKLTHRPEEQYRCDYPGCGYTSNWPKNLKTHRLSHNPEQLVRCDFEGCEFVSKWATNLCQHKKIHDTRPNRREFRCDYDRCDYVTKWSGDLKKHKLIHSREFPFQCDRCQFKTKRLDRLKLHQKRKHPIKQELVAEEEEEEEEEVEMELKGTTFS